MIRKRNAFTLVEIMIVVAIIAIVVAIAVPAFMRARENARGRGCQENLAKIDGAKQQYTLEKKVAEGATIPDGALWESNSTGYLRSEPVCPADRSSYTIGNIGTDPTCPNDDVNTPFVRHVNVGTI